ncbi:unnamed protein product [Rangifer tarandus platyrhynchus]|uniref:Uncharacterized protein n=1 Tax=Rangifer tarandus platyrhynchus TaxID=3082113 RepID=A0ABN8XZ54_RANTA|nr:unnamed protein product [Rangifer tarandus platyrhynchus]
MCSLVSLVTPASEPSASTLKRHSLCAKPYSITHLMQKGSTGVMISISAPLRLLDHPQETVVFLTIPKRYVTCAEYKVLVQAPPTGILSARWCQLSPGFLPTGQSLGLTLVPSAHSRVSSQEGPHLHGSWPAKREKSLY